MALTYEEQRELNRQKAESALRKEEVETVVSALAKVMGAQAELAGVRAKTSQAFRTAALKAIGSIDQAAAQGSGAAYIRGMVELQKLAVESPIDFAKTAYAKDPALLGKVLMAAPAVFGKEADPQVNRRAWETFLDNYPAASGNLLGSYEEMVKLYGPLERAELDVGNPKLMERVNTLTDTLDTERKAAEDWRNRYGAVVNAPKTYDQWTSERGLDPTLDETYERYARDLGLDMRVPAYAPKQVQYLKGLVNDDFTETIGTDIEQQGAHIEYLKGLLNKESEKGQESWSERDILAAWLEKPQTQEWADRNGLRVGRVLPLTDELKKQIEDGKYPGHVFVKSGIYVPGADDQKAFRMAEKQLKREPERNVGRALGLTLGSQTAIEIDMKPPPSKRPVSGYSDSKDGIIVKLADGSLYQQADGYDEWKRIEALPEDAGEEKPLTGGQDILPVKTFKGAYRKPRAGDPEGSYRFVDVATGREEIIVPEDIAKVRMSQQPGAGLKPRPLDAVRQAQAERVVAKSTPPPVPAPAAPAAPAPTAQEKAVPMPAPPPLPKGSDQPPPFTDKQKQDLAMQKADAALEMTRPPRPKRVIPEVPAQPYPEPIRRAFRRPVDQRDTNPR